MKRVRRSSDARGAVAPKTTCRARLRAAPGVDALGGVPR
ncbi:hypothetical protein GA0074695_1976 [Micromonospora viridifaciens]|uniref:Uncharacterized protein n=1 Tax=Micromonospora viridifaciens TaxID=1881 RepID=A0A1C4W067_MICVI|nr:hypothetical protein GA0074695_1976 [Micromonospora viridifaciens]